MRVAKTRGRRCCACCAATRTSRPPCRWVFELDTQPAGRTRVRALTWADFPGIHGKTYRALVIGTGAHRVAVRWTLKRIVAAVLAERAQTGETAADYTDVFEVPILHGDLRSAEQALRDAL